MGKIPLCSLAKREPAVKPRRQTVTRTENRLRFETSPRSEVIILLLLFIVSFLHEGAQCARTICCLFCFLPSTPFLAVSDYANTPYLSEDWELLQSSGTERLF